MAHSKRRVYQHIMEDKSISLLRSRLPEEWVIREYRPDYGIDLAIEIFNFVDSERTKADSLGEWFFSQVKSISKTKINKLKVFSRHNVEKVANKIDSNEFLEIDVIRFRLETDELLTIQAMGSGVPVILFLVALDSQRVFFVCLNDLIDKVILPEDPNYAAKSTKTIYIPIKNEIKLNDEVTLAPLRFYAKRPKLYSAFSKFTYQEDEVRYFADNISTMALDEIPQCYDLNTVRHFLRIIKRYDFWETTRMWSPIFDSYEDIISLECLIDKIIRTGKLEISDFHQTKSIEMGFDPVEYTCFLFKCKIIFTWQRLKNLNNMYEEVCREWYLPTFLAQYLSYAEYPKA
jgi:hypothetical protein